MYTVYYAVWRLCFLSRESTVGDRHSFRGMTRNRVHVGFGKLYVDVIMRVKFWIEKFLFAVGFSELYAKISSDSSNEYESAIFDRAFIPV